jgi:hypothetical protein
MYYNESLFDLQGTAGVLVYTSYKVCGILSAMPKKPNDDKALYTYAGLVFSYSSLNYTRICHATKMEIWILIVLSVCSLQNVAAREFVNSSVYGDRLDAPSFGPRVLLSNPVLRR